MLTLLESIAAAFAADAHLPTLFPGGIWSEAAPEGTPPPYAIYKVTAAPLTAYYGSAEASEITVRFTAYGVGLDSTLSKCQTLAAFLRDRLLSLSSSQNYDARQTTDPIPERQGRDSSTTDDPAQGDVYAVHVTFAYAVRTG